MASRTALLDSALALLDQYGLEALTLDEVRTRAGVAGSIGPVVWRSKAELLVDLLRHHAADPDLGADERPTLDALTEALWTLIRNLGALRTLIATAGAEAAHDPEIAAELRLFVDSWQAGIRLLVQRSADRGELSGNLKGEDAVDLLTALAWFRSVLTPDPPLLAPELRRLVAMVLESPQR